jgi:hypothetical protein
MSIRLLTGVAASSGVKSQYKIANSVRIESPDASEFSRTPSSTGNTNKFTLSTWAKRAIPGAYLYLGSYSNFSGTGWFDNISFNSSGSLDFLLANSSNSGMAARVTTSSIHNDFASWYHIVVSVDTTQATASDRIKIYINGSLITDLTNSTYPSQNFNFTNINVSGRTHYIGREAWSSPNYSNGYIAEYHHIDGQALSPTSFGEVDSTTNMWIPKQYTGSYGTNGFYLNFSDSSNTTATTLGKDYSGNSNNLTPIGFTVSSGINQDILLDSPTDYGTDTGLGGQVRGNYATINPQDTVSYSASGLPFTYDKGNLRITSNTTSDSNSTGSTFVIPPNSGKWYYEATYTQISTGGSGFFWNYVKDSDNFSNVIGHCIAYSAANPWGSYGYYNSATGSGVGTTSISNGDVFKVAIDSDTRKIYMGHGSSWYNSGNPSTGTNPIGTLSGTGPIILAFGARTGSTTQVIDFNFGQRSFTYTAPTNFKALCTTNLPVPAIIKPYQHYDAVLYAGTSSGSTSVGSFSFAPDLVWIKNRTDYVDGSSNNMLYDVIRGTTKSLSTDKTDTELTLATGLNSFNQTGFNPGSSTRTNETGKNYIAWGWEAGSSNTTNTDGSVTSTVRVNQTAGFSIVQYNTGSNSNAYTVGHGLGKAPKFIMIKGGYTTDTYNWDIYHQSLGPTKRLKINSTDGPETQGGPWDNTTPSSTLIYQNNQNNFWYGTNRNIIAYCWTDIPGYSKFASYTGTPSSQDGPFVYLGFRPAWVLIKRTDIGGDYWNLMDSKRDIVNVSNATNRLYPNSINNDEIGNVTVDFLSNGFRIRDTNSNNNGNGMTYVYAAFAEAPFKYARAR